MIAKPTGCLGRLDMRRRKQWISGADHVAIVIAARSDGVETGGDDALNVLSEIRLEHAVKLEGLPRRQSQRAVCRGASLRIERQPLSRGADAARKAHANHELIERLEAREPTLIAH